MVADDGEDDDHLLVHCPGGRVRYSRLCLLGADDESVVVDDVGGIVVTLSVRDQRRNSCPNLSTGAQKNPVFLSLQIQRQVKVEDLVKVGVARTGSFAPRSCMEDWVVDEQ